MSVGKDGQVLDAAALVREASEELSWADAGERNLIEENLRETARFLAGSMLDGGDRAHLRGQLERVYTRLAVLDMAAARDSRRYEAAERERLTICRVSLEHMAKAIEDTAVEGQQGVMMAFANRLARVVWEKHGITRFGQGPLMALSQVAKILGNPDGRPVTGDDAERMQHLVALARGIPEDTCWGNPEVADFAAAYAVAYEEIVARGGSRAA